MKVKQYDRNGEHWVEFDDGTCGVSIPLDLALSLELVDKYGQVLPGLREKVDSVFSLTADFIEC
jgi:hypothetical protein